jgi:CheY-like chemotaxis protein
MFLILAIEPDRRQANRLAAIGRGPLRNAELVTVETVQAALELLARRVPDLVLTSMLISAKDDSALAERLRQLDTPGRQVQTLVIPLFAAPRKSDGGLLARFTKSDDEGSAHGCQPAVFAAQINEYLDDMQLDREARELRQPYTAPAETFYQQPSVTDAYQEVVASVSAEQVIGPLPTMPAEPPVAEQTTSTIEANHTIDAEPTPAPTAVPPRPPLVRPAASTASPRSTTPPSILKEPARVTAPSVIKPAPPIEAPRPVEPPRVVEARVVEPPRVVAPPRAVEPARDVEPLRSIEPARELEAAASVETPTAEPARLIAPSPIIEPRRSVAKPARSESIIKPADDDLQTEPVAEPARMIAPSPMATPEHVAPAAAAHAPEPETPRAPLKPAPAASRPATPTRARPKVARVQFVGPLHEDPEVAKFMAALNELPTVDVVESGTDANAETAQVELPAAAATPREPEPALNPTPLLSRAAALAETVAAQETITAPTEPATPKTVKALKPARARTISPAAAPPPLPPSARKRVTAIRREASSPAQPDPAPEAPPGAEEPPAVATNTPVKVVGRIKPASSAPVAPAAPRTVKPKGAPRRPRPVQDEWGLFDPDQAGLKAVQAALEEIEEPDIFRNVSKPPKSRS